MSYGATPDGSISVGIGNEPNSIFAKSRAGSIKSVASDVSSAGLYNSSYTVYWDSLKASIKLFLFMIYIGFLRSNWCNIVDSILIQALPIEVAKATSVRPAELFYNTCTEIYLTSTSVNQYLLVLKNRMGASWDDKLEEPARVLFTTSRAVATVVGAGKFVGGAIQLGRSKITSVIDQLCSHWDNALEKVVGKRTTNLKNESIDFHTVNALTDQGADSDQETYAQDNNSDDELFVHHKKSKSVNMTSKKTAKVTARAGQLAKNSSFPASFSTVYSFQFKVLCYF